MIIKCCKGSNGQTGCEKRKIQMYSLRVKQNPTVVQKNVQIKVRIGT